MQLLQQPGCLGTRINRLAVCDLVLRGGAHCEVPRPPGRLCGLLQGS